MKEFLNSWLFIAIVFAISVGTYFFYREEFLDWTDTLLINATLSDLVLIAIYHALYIQITRKS